MPAATPAATGARPLEAGRAPPAGADRGWPHPSAASHVLRYIVADRFIALGQLEARRDDARAADDLGYPVGLLVLTGQPQAETGGAETDEARRRIIGPPMRRPAAPSDDVVLTVREGVRACAASTSRPAYPP